MCDTPPTPGVPTNVVQVVPVPASRLEASRQSPHRERARRKRLQLPEPPPQFRALDGDVDATIWLVVTQTTALQPYRRDMYNVVIAAKTFHVAYGQQSVLTDQIGPWQYLPGTIEVYALSTAQDVEIARSAAVRIDVPDHPRS